MLVVSSLFSLVHEGSRAHYLTDGNSSAEGHVEQQECSSTAGGDPNSAQFTEQAVGLYLGL